MADNSTGPKRRTGVYTRDWAPESEQTDPEEEKLQLQASTEEPGSPKFVLGNDDSTTDFLAHEAEHVELNTFRYPDVFTELEELTLNKHGEAEWKETGRWIKFEEDVEEGSDRWSKPFVPTVFLPSLFELRNCILNGTILLDVKATTLAEIADLVIDNQVELGQVDESTREQIKDSLLLRKKHQNMPRMRKTSSFNLLKKAEMGHHHLPNSKSLDVFKSESTRIRRNFSVPGFRTHDAAHGSEKRRRISVPAKSGVRASAAGVEDGVPDTEKRRRVSVPASAYKSSASADIKGDDKSEEHTDGDGNSGDQAADDGNKRDDQAAGDDKSGDHAVHTSGTNTLPLPGRHSDSGNPHESTNGGHATVEQVESTGNIRLMKKLSTGSEASNVLVGEVDFLIKPLVAFVRLAEARLIENLVEVPLPSRFLFILIGARGSTQRLRQVGRCIATLMADEHFHDVAYMAKSREDLLEGVDHFLDGVTVLPPGTWDPSIRIPPPKKMSEVNLSSKQDLIKDSHTDEDHVEDGVAPTTSSSEEDVLKRSGSIFGGLVRDVRRKLPWYVSDYTESLSLQTLASICFMYFALVAPVVTFGGLLGKATDNRQATVEYILAASLTGCLWSVASGQPLIIMSATGPMLVIEAIIYHFCSSNSLEYLTFRLWIGIWIFLLLLVLVAVDASFLVKYITRFTQECFCVLVAFILIFEGVTKMNEIARNYPSDTPSYWFNSSRALRSVIQSGRCVCNGSDGDAGMDSALLVSINGSQSRAVIGTTYPMMWRAVVADTCPPGTHVTGDACDAPVAVPDVFYFSVLLFLGTFLVDFWIRSFTESSYFPTKVRQVISYFSVTISVLLMCIMDYFSGLPTPKLTVPNTFRPTGPDREWLVAITPVDTSELWIIAATIPPAIVCVILIFMDQQITALIINRKENMLRKGSGYHLDLLVCALAVLICSVLGIPWCMASTVPSVTHVNSLRVEDHTVAPGEDRKLIGCRENRVTNFVCSLLIGLSVFMTDILKFVPMPVLFGVFLIMGYTSVRDIQFIERLLIMFMPQKYQPERDYLQRVQTKRVHAFTLIQLLCFVIMWIFISIEQTSAVFPLTILVLVAARKLMERLFTSSELMYLDDLEPTVAAGATADQLTDSKPADGAGSSTPRATHHFVINGRSAADYARYAQYGVRARGSEAQRLTAATSGEESQASLQQAHQLTAEDRTESYHTATKVKFSV